MHLFPPELANPLYVKNNSEKQSQNRSSFVLWRECVSNSICIALIPLNRGKSLCLYELFEVFAFRCISCFNLIAFLFISWTLFLDIFAPFNIASYDASYDFSKILKLWLPALFCDPKSWHIFVAVLFFFSFSFVQSQLVIIESHRLVRCSIEMKYISSDWFLIWNWNCLRWAFGRHRHVCCCVYADFFLLPSVFPRPFHSLSFIAFISINFDTLSTVSALAFICSSSRSVNWWTNFFFSFTFFLCALVSVTVRCRLFFSIAFDLLTCHSIINFVAMSVEWKPTNIDMCHHNRSSKNACTHVVVRQLIFTLFVVAYVRSRIKDVYDRRR
jgi:hypothetical protein